MEDYIILGLKTKIIFAVLIFTFKMTTMQDLQKSTQNNSKSVKNAKEEISKGNSSKPASNHSGGKDDAKAGKKSSSSHSK